MFMLSPCATISFTFCGVHEIVGAAGDATGYKNSARPQMLTAINDNSASRIVLIGDIADLPLLRLDSILQSRTTRIAGGMK